MNVSGEVVVKGSGSGAFSTGKMLIWLYTVNRGLDWYCWRLTVGQPDPFPLRVYSLRKGNPLAGKLE